MTDMTPTAVRAAIEALIKAGTSSDLGALERIYHRDMQILMQDEAGSVQRFDKPAFIAMLENAVSGTRPEDHQWARFDAVDAKGDRGHVLITRRVPLAGDDKLLTLSIDLRHEDDRWQVTREVILVRPDPQGAPV